jgi:hypothetical protein
MMAKNVRIQWIFIVDMPRHCQGSGDLLARLGPRGLCPINVMAKKKVSYMYLFYYERKVEFHQNEECTRYIPHHPVWIC